VGVGFVGAAIALHFAFCEWHFDDSATGAYSILEFSRKPNPLLQGFRNPVQTVDIVNGLFARNRLPRVGAEVEPTARDRQMGIISMRHVGTSSSLDPHELIATQDGQTGIRSTSNTGQVLDTYMLIATLLGLFLPVILLIVGAYMFYLNLRMRLPKTASAK